MKRVSSSLMYVAVIISLITIATRATNNMVTTTVGPLAKYQFGFSNVQVGILTAVMYATTLFSTSYLNPVLVSTMRRKLFIASNGAIAILLLAFFVSSPILVWPISALAGLAFGLVMPNLITSASLVNDKRWAERLLSLYSASLSISLILGPAYESFLLTRFTYKYVFLAFIPLAVLAFILSWRVSFPNLSREVHGLSALRNKGLLASVLAITTYNVPFAAITTFLTILSIDRFRVPSDLAYFTFFPFFLTSFLTRFYMTVRPFKSLRTPMLVSVILTALGVGSVLVAPSYFVFLALMAVLGIPHGSVFPMATIMIQRATSKEERNAVNSYFLAYNNILFIVVPVAVGYLSQLMGLSLAFSILAVPVIASSVAFFSLFWRDQIMGGSSP